MYTVGWFNTDTVFHLLVDRHVVIVLLALLNYHAKIDYLTLTLIIFPIALLYSISAFNTFYKRFGPKWDPLGENDVAIITGGSNGLGLDLVKLLLNHGVKVINIDKEVSNVLKHENLYYHQCDLNNLNQLNEVIEKIQKSGLEPTVLINNAAIRHSQSFFHLSQEQMHTIENINLKAPLLLLKSFIKPDSKRLYIVNVASVLGLLNPVNLSMYSLTKAALVSIHESLTYELTNPNIKLLLVLPGQLNTSLFKDVKPPKQFFAPVVKSDKLALKIIEKIQLGERGELYLPLFTRFVPLMRMFPNCVRDLLRWLSELDTSVHEQ